MTEPHQTCHLSADTYLLEAGAELLVAFMPTEVANTVIMGLCRCTAIGLCNLHGQQLLLLC